MRSTLPVLLLSACACDAGSESKNQLAGPAVRDSAGITIVENPDATAADTLSWRADTSNILRIGTFDGVGPDVFGRIAGVARLSDGRIVIADAEAHELRFFAADGSFLTRTGRRGGGPGEYEYFSGMLKLPGDSLLVIDHEGGRLTVLSPRGTYVRSFRFETESGETQRSNRRSMRGVFDDGTFLIGEFLNACRESRSRGGLCQDSMRYMRNTEAGDRLADFGPQAYRRHDLIPLPNGRNYGFSDPHAQVFWSVHGDRFFIADAARFEIRAYDRTGRLERIVRLAHKTVPVPGSMHDPPPRSVNTEVERQRNADIAEAYARRTWPEHLPAFGSFTVDRAGNLWVREYPALNGNYVPPRWLVFDSTGVIRNRVRLPSIEIVPRVIFRWRGEIGNDFVLGVLRDRDGVESVWLVPLLKART